MEAGDDGIEPQPPGRDERQRLFEQARQAASAGDEKGMLAALVASDLLVGLKRRLIARARRRGTLRLHPDDADFALTRATSTLFEKVRGGEQVHNVAGFLLKVADKRVVDDFREGLHSVDPTELQQRTADQEENVLDQLIAEEERQA